MPATPHERPSPTAPRPPGGAGLLRAGDHDDLAGLSAAQAREALARVGPNEIQDAERHGLLDTLRSVASEPMFLLLVVAAGLYLLLGDLGEGLLLAFFAGVTVGLVILQERRSERALEALRELAAPQVRVRRDGEVRRLPARELVPGDIVLVSEGERVAADAVVRECAGLSADESLLTGESVPVRKVALVNVTPEVAGMAGVPRDDGRAPAGPPVDALAAAARLDDTPGGDDTPFLHAGTLVTAGHAVAQVRATGRATRVGRIGASLAAIAPAPTPLERQLRRLVRVFGVGALALSAVLVAWYGVVRGDWLAGLLSGLALGMGMLPEEFPMALAVFLALGAWRLARVRVLARRPAVIEAFGAITLLCVDKTGTLTENRMRARRLVTPGGEADLAADAPLDAPTRTLLEHAVLASRREATDPMDRALHAAGDRRLAGTAQLHPEWRLEHEYPLTPGLLAMSHAWLAPDGRRHVAAKGAPEAIADLCHLDGPAAAAWRDRMQALATRGLRVLGVARGTSAPGRPTDTAEDELHDYDFEYLGLVAFEDPLRPGVPEAMAQARSAGVQVAMITGDHLATALAIAREAGIDTAAGALDGPRLAAMDDAALAHAVREVRVFARVQPEQKLRLVQAFQANGETVAMTGDGVNDAPALKAAHVGLAMGARGTDVAREAAAIVLLDDDFGHIVGGVRLGRRIFDNLRKVMTYITAVHVPIAGLALLPVLAGWPPLMLPVHVVLTEMVVDPVCSLAFEGAPEEPDVMSRPPRPASRGLVGWPMLARGLLQGGAVLGAVLAVYGHALSAGVPADTARALGIVGMMAGNLMLVALNASEGLGPAALLRREFLSFWAVAVVALSAIAAGLLFEGPRRLLRFGLPEVGQVGMAVAAVALALGVASLLASRLPSAAPRRRPVAA